MYGYLVKLYLIAAAIQLGFSLMELEKCSGRKCVQKLDQASRKVLKIDWKPISVFPEEAKRFR